MFDEGLLSKLRDVIRQRAIVTKDQHRIISPGGVEQEWLLDLKRILLEPEVLNTITELFWQRFEREYPFQVGGLELAAIPIVSAIVAKSRALRKPVTGFMMRKARKPTGLQNIVEGDISQEKIVLVDDIVNSGKTLLYQINVLETVGRKADYVFTVVNFRGPEQIASLQEKGITLVSLLPLEALGLRVEESPVAIRPSFQALWRFQGPDPNYFYRIPKSGPCLDQEKIYFGTDDGHFWALRQSDGSVAWKFRVGYSTSGKNIFSSPAVHQGVVYFGAYDGNVYALDTADGTLRWKFTEADWIGSSPAIASNLGLLFIGLEVAVPGRRGGIVALDLNTGEKVWEYSFPEYVHASPAYCPGLQVVAIGGNDCVACLFDAKSGKLRWAFKTDGEIKASFCFSTKHGLLLFGSYDQHLYGLDIDSGALRMKLKSNDTIYSTPCVYQDTVFVTSADKNVYAVDIVQRETRWRFQAGGRILASPIIAEGHVFFGANDGRLYELDPNSGKLVGYFQLTERITNAIAYNPLTCRFFVPTYSNEIYCLYRL